MRKLLFFLVLIFLILNESSSQKIYGFAENHFGSFDLTDKSPDTLITFNSNPWINLGFRAAIDKFNGRYFFGGTIPGHYGYFHVIDLNDLTIDSYSPYPENIEYDFIRNRLVYEDDGKLYSLSLKTMEVNLIGEIENWNSIIYGQNRTYIPQTNQYLYTKYDDPYNGYPYYLLVDVSSATIDCQAIIEEYNGYHYGTAGFVTNYFTGDVIAHRNGRYGIVDPCNGTTTKLSTIPDYYSHLNNQMAVFNHLDTTYIIPYYSDNPTFHYKYAIIDVYKDQIIETFDQPWEGEMDLQQLYEKPIAPLIFFQDTLFVPYGNNYKWYRNNTLIAETDENFYRPIENGEYKAEIQFSRYTTFSNELNIVISSINNRQIDSRIKIYPNPTSNYITISVDNSKLMNLTILDLAGRIHFEKSYRNTNSDQINLTSFPVGVYFLRILTEEMVISRQIIKK